MVSKWVELTAGMMVDMKVVKKAVTTAESMVDTTVEMWVDEKAA